MDTPFSPAPGLVVLPSHAEAPGLGKLPVHAFVLRGDAPVLVDAGQAVDEPAFLDALDTVIAPESLRAIVITHEDADHTGALAALLRRAPAAALVTTPVGAGKLTASLSLPLERLRIVVPGQRLHVGGRRFRALPAPLYDSPATFQLLEETEGFLFSSDAFGAFVPEIAERAEDLDERAVLDGVSLFGRLNSPWVSQVEPASFRRSVEALAGARLLLGSHLPPVRGRLLAAVLARAAGLPAEGAVEAPGEPPAVVAA